uniref:Uncharacterized protein n=1 Tax=Heterorhabditis bacteriophora TaxID=37862 RepID=A0A1I7XQ17_HETBA
MMENGVNLEYAKIIDNNSRAVHAVIIYTLWKLIWDQEDDIASKLQIDKLVIFKEY